MKKKKILSAFAALAVAFCGAVIPAQKNTGVNVLSAAAVITPSGGISAEVLDPDNDPPLTALEYGQLFDVKVTIPAIDNRFDTVDLVVTFDANAFEYQAGANSDWDNSTDVITAFSTAGAVQTDIADAYVSYEEDTAKGTKTGKLYMTLSGSENDPTNPEKQWKFKMTNDIVIKARMKVISRVGTNYTFSIDTNATDISYFSGANGDYPNSTWKPLTTEANVHIANTFSGFISGYDFAGEGDIHISLVDKSGNLATLKDGTVINPILVNAADGFFEFKSMPETGEYYLQLDKWCVFEDFVSAGTNPDGSVQGNDIVCKCEVKSADLTVTSSAMIPGSTDIRKEVGTFKVRMFGDVNDSASIQANDATRILNHVVGRTVFEEDLDLAIANVLQDGVINAKDATQVLRHTIGLASCYDRHTTND